MEVFITHAKRTAIGNFMGCFSSVSAVTLGVQVIKALIEDSKINPSDVVSLVPVTNF